MVVFSISRGPQGADPDGTYTVLYGGIMAVLAHGLESLM